MAENDFSQLDQILSANPSDSIALWKRALGLVKVGNYDAALIDLYALLRLEPKNLEARNQIRYIHKSLIGCWHFDMMNDAVRNSAYERAIQHLIKPGMTVFEIGTGSGLLSMLAVRSGASHVWTCEKSMPIRNAAREIIRKNGFEKKITILDSWSTSVQVPRDIPEKVDVVLGEIFGSGLLEEQAVHFFNDARMRLLKPGGRVLPASATMYGMLFEGEAIAKRAVVGEVCGFDLRLFSGLHDDPTLQLNLNQHSHSALSSGVILQKLNFNESLALQEENKLKITANQDGICHGVAQWFSLEFDGGVIFDTAPTSTRTHWDQHVQIFEKPFAVKKGEDIEFLVRRFSDRFSLHRIS